uniref:Beta-spectrin n=1 Tax=Cyriopagopus schmidti TaxID=29017 RepID=B5M6F1_CYRSC|nr:beta-spectrin [Cyriopagopus schmidti]
MTINSHSKTLHTNESRTTIGQYQNLYTYHKRAEDIRMHETMKIYVTRNKNINDLEIVKLSYA